MEMIIRRHRHNPSRLWTQVRTLLVLLRVPEGLNSEEAVYQRCRVNHHQEPIRDDETQSWLGAAAAGIGECEACLLPVDSCPEATMEASFRYSNPYHVLIQLTTPKLEKELLSIAAALLMKNYSVTVFYLDLDRTTIDDYHDILRDEILLAIPCSQMEAAVYRLWLEPIEVVPAVRNLCSKVMNTATTASATRSSNTIGAVLEPLQSCVVVLAATEYRAPLLEFSAQGDSVSWPDVILTDLYGLGTIFFAEEWGIPSLVLTDEASYYHSIASRNASSFSIWEYIASTPNQLWHSLATTKSVSDLNRLREALGLQRKRRGNDFWDAATSILILADRLNAQPPVPQTAKLMFPTLLHFAAPILPPCLSCSKAAAEDGLSMLRHPTSNSGRSSVVLVVRVPTYFTPRKGREVLRGLALTRKSLFSGAAASACDKSKSSRHGPSNCWHDIRRIDLRVLWLVDTEAFNYPYLLPDPLPSFVYIQSASLYLTAVLGTVQHREQQQQTKTDKGGGINHIVVLAECEYHARTAILLDVPTLCFPPIASPVRRSRSLDNDDDDNKNTNNKFQYLHTLRAREIATKLVRLVGRKLNEASPPARTPPTTATKLDEEDGLQRVVTIVGRSVHLVPTPSPSRSPSRGGPVKPRMIQDLFILTMRAKDRPIEPLRQNKQRLKWVYCRPLWWISWTVLTMTLAFVGGKYVPTSGTQQLRIASRRKQVQFLLLHPFWDVVGARIPELERAVAAMTRLWESKSRKKKPSQKRNGRNSDNRHQPQQTTLSEKGRSTASKQSNGHHKKRTGKHR